MGTDEKMVKNPSLEEFHGVNGARVSGDEQIDVNMPLKEVMTRENVGNVNMGVEEGCVNGESDGLKGVNGDDGLTQMGNCVVNGDGNGYGSEEKSLMTPPPRRRGRRPKSEGGGSSYSDVKGGRDKAIVDGLSNVSQRTRNRVVRGKKEDVDDVDVVANSSELDGEGEQESGFSVGDFVWGKIKSHPWWPGRIYSSSDASEFAMRYKHEGRLLVAYFGDGTFAWCDSSQLEPFEQNFEEMSKQSSLKSFVNAVEEAVEEFGRLVQLQMSCSCARKESSLPLVVNAGIKEGVRVPRDGVEKFSADQFEPTVLLADLKSYARLVSVTNMLELRVLKSRLSAFYHAKGVYSFPVYYEPVQIGELVLPLNEGSTRGPVEEDCSVGPGDLLMQTGPEKPGDTSCKRRKEKTIAELLETDTIVQSEEIDIDSSKGETQSGKLALKSGKKRRKVTDEVQTELDDHETGITKEAGQSGNLASKSGRKRKIVDENKSLAENLRITRSSSRKKEGTARLTTTKVRASDVKEDGGVDKGQKVMIKSPKDRKMHVSLRVDNGHTSEEGQERMSPRERKKSKYLSPPYTSLLQKQTTSSSQMESEAGGLKFSDVARMGERMAKAAGKIVGSPPTMKYNAETFQKSSRGSGSAHKRNDQPDHPKCTTDLSSSVNDSVKNSESPNKVLGEVRSVALDPKNLRTGQYMGNRQKRKKNMSDSKLGSEVRVHNQVDPHLSELKTLGRCTSKKKELKSDLNADEELTNESTSSAALLMTFSPESTLPSKEDLIRLHAKFGLLNESKSKVVPKTSSAKIVFVKSSDAEAAMKYMQQSSPFGTAQVSYKIRHLAASKKKKVDEQNKKKSKLPETEESKSMDKNLPPATENGSTGNEPLAVVFIKQKLEAMTSMLGQTDGKMTKEIKSNLENEAKDLLKKVKMMTASSSSLS